ncbi:hypothetical protein [Streptomyces sp. NPDC086010]|uniref:hypothetical protein n=1 Tax=Streptomyces sp. NPDC086010 TaxID=3365745 RepID=UPI0037D307A0
MEFFSELGTSLLASAIFLALVWVFSRTARRLMRGLAAHLLHLDVEEVFPNSRDAAQDIRRELGRARRVSVLTSRGAELQRELFEELFLRCRARRSRCRILLPKLDVPAGEPDWITDREEEIQVFDPAFGAGLLRRQIAASYDYLAPLAVEGHLETRGYGIPHIGRIIATERVVYLTPYSADRHGRESPVIKYRRGETYDVLVRLIDKLWVAGSA